MFSAKFRVRRHESIRDFRTGIVTIKLADTTDLAPVTATYAGTYVQVGGAEIDVYAYGTSIPGLALYSESPAKSTFERITDTASDFGRDLVSLFSAPTPQELGLPPGTAVPPLPLPRPR